MYERKIYLDDPSLGEIEKKYLSKAIDSGYVSTAGSFVIEFEEKFRDYIATKKCVATQNGTSAIHIALYELGINESVEMIVPVLTFAATVNPILYLRATPIFVDVDIKTWNIAPSEIERSVTKKTKAIIPVHLYGNPCSMNEIMEIAKKHDLYVIEDATESLGSRYNGKYTGTFGNFGCFSFNGNKLITTGGGGMVVSDDEDAINHIKFLINQAKSMRDGAYYHTEIGFNYRMTNIEAALGLAQMERLGEFLFKKKRFNQIYRDILKDLEFVRFQEHTENTESFYWLTSIIIEREIDILKLHTRLKEKGIPTRRLFMPLVEFPPYKKFKKSNYKNAYSIYEKGLSLPSSTLNSEEDIIFAAQVVRDVLKNV